MPRATVKQAEATHNLRTLEGAWVKLRPLNYGEILERREMAAKMSTVSKPGVREQDIRTLIDIMQRKTRQFEFARCIVDHNLFEDDEELVKLNFSNPLTIDALDPKVGQEIEKRIDELNQDEEDLDPNLLTSNGSSTSS